MLDTPYVDLDPDYQRAFVWSVDRQIQLVTSLLCTDPFPVGT